MKTAFIKEFSSRVSEFLEENPNSAIVEDSNDLLFKNIIYKYLGDKVNGAIQESILR